MVSSLPPTSSSVAPSVEPDSFVLRSLHCLADQRVDHRFLAGEVLLG